MSCSENEHTRFEGENKSDRMKVDKQCGSDESDSEMKDKELLQTKVNITIGTQRISIAKCVLKL